MASENQWAYDLESTVVALVRAKSLPQLKKKYPKIRITDEESASTEAVFPTAYIHMIGGNEKGKTLDGRSINSVNATFRLEVTANKKADCKKVTDTLSEIFKQMRFEITLPRKTIDNKIYRSVCTFSRVISANDKLL